jgi:hypothetical protein
MKKARDFKTSYNKMQKNLFKEKANFISLFKSVKAVINHLPLRRSSRF